MIKYAHRDFPSDVFVLLEALNVGIDVLVVDNGESFTCSPAELMDINMTGKVSFSLLCSWLGNQKYQLFIVKAMSCGVCFHSCL